MNNIEYIMDLFVVSKEKAEELIASGLNVDAMRQGWSKELNAELTEIDVKLKTVVETFFSEESS